MQPGAETPSAVRRNPNESGRLTIILGASDFPRHAVFSKQTDKNAAFYRSTMALHELFLGLGIATGDCCNLCDLPIGPAELMSVIADFVRARCRDAVAAGRSISDLFICYVGHGTGDGEGYTLLLRNSTPALLNETGLRFASLVKSVKSTCDEILREHRFPIRQYYILDACHSGRARFAASLSSGAKGALPSITDQPSTGAAVLCSCNEQELSFTPTGSNYTLFTTALVTALTCPPDERARMRSWYPETNLSLARLREIIQRWQTSQTPAGGEVPPTPQVIPIDTYAGDVQDVPLFPNPLASPAPDWPLPIGPRRLRFRGLRNIAAATLLTATALGSTGTWLAPSLVEILKWFYPAPVPPPHPIAATPVVPQPGRQQWRLGLGEVFAPGTLERVEFSEIPLNRRLNYELTTARDAASVVWNLPYAATHAAGGPIEGCAFYRPLFAWQFPNLSFFVENGDEQPLRLTEAIVQVKEVERDDRPLLVLQDRSYRSLQFRNEGWGTVVDPVVEFSLRPLHDESAVTDFDQQLPLSTFEEKFELKLARYVPAGLAKQPEIAAIGRITFGPTGSRTAVTFRTRILLELTSGGPMKPSFDCDVRLDSSGPGTRTVTLAQEIEPGQSDLILLRVASDRSARYVLDIELKSFDRSLGRQQLRLEVFVPRSAAAHDKSATLSSRK